MEIKSVSLNNFGIATPPVYIHTVTENIPAIVQNVPMIKTVTVTEKYYKMPVKPIHSSNPLPEKSAQDEFIRKEAVVADPKIRIPQTSKNTPYIYTIRLKQAGRKNRDKRITY